MPTDDQPNITAEGRRSQPPLTPLTHRVSCVTRDGAGESPAWALAIVHVRIGDDEMRLALPLLPPLSWADERDLAQKMLHVALPPVAETIAAFAVKAHQAGILPSPTMQNALLFIVQRNGIYADAMSAAVRSLRPRPADPPLVQVWRADPDQPGFLVKER